MFNLLKKEFKINIHPVYLVVPILFGLLMFIPYWIYSIVFFYYFWITVPNMFGAYNQQRDLIFTQMLPVRRADIVKSRILATVLIQLLHIFFAVIFGIINVALYGPINYFALDINAALFGIAFILYGGFNIVFLPKYFKTGYRYGKALLFASVYSIMFATALDLLNGFLPEVNMVLEGSDYALYQYLILVGGILIYALLTFIATKLSIKHFDELL